MNTQEIWFSMPAEWPAQGCITDGVEGKSCVVFAYAGFGTLAQRLEADVAPLLPASSSLPPPTGSENPDAASLPTPAIPVIVEATQTGSVEVTPETHPNLHTILDRNQVVPQVMREAKALGFHVTYQIHEAPDEVVTL